MDSLSEGDTKDMLVNPFYAIVLAEHLFEPHKPDMAQEDWVQQNDELMEKLGEKEWLERLLRLLSPKSSDDIHDKLINPYQAVLFSDRLLGDHPPLVTPELWVQANTKMIAELGYSEWLWRLLKVLETGGV